MKMYWLHLFSIFLIYALSSSMSCFISDSWIAMCFAFSTIILWLDLSGILLIVAAIKTLHLISSTNLTSSHWYYAKTISVEGRYENVIKSIKNQLLWSMRKIKEMNGSTEAWDDIIINTFSVYFLVIAGNLFPKYSQICYRYYMSRYKYLRNHLILFKLPPSTTLCITTNMSRKSVYDPISSTRNSNSFIWLSLALNLCSI